MDQEVADSASKNELNDGLQNLSNKMNADFGGPIKATFISSEKTTHEKLPSIFLIFKVESDYKFGYYFFYLNEVSGKILLVSEFSRVKEKRV